MPSGVMKSNKAAADLWPATGGAGRISRQVAEMTAAWRNHRMSMDNSEALECRQDNFQGRPGD